MINTFTGIFQGNTTEKKIQKQTQSRTSVKILSIQPQKKITGSYKNEVWWVLYYNNVESARFVFLYQMHMHK